MLSRMPTDVTVHLGEVGEISIGGAGVARGYVGLPEETLKRFVPDPFAPPVSLEWDLTEIGDRVALNDDCVLQTHLFEDRVLKASRLQIGADCAVGADSVVL